MVQYLFHSESSGFWWIRCLFLTALLLISPFCAAWSTLGHLVVCELAFQSVTPQTRVVIKRLAKSDVEPRFRTFAQGCVWADTIRKRLPEYDPDHYLNVPRNRQSIRSSDCPEQRRCVLTAIARDRAIASNPEYDDYQRWRSLKLLGHWVADLHQPLHVSYEDDRGGGLIKVDVSPELCDRENLHQVWDDCLVRWAMMSGGEQLSVKAFVSSLLQQTHYSRGAGRPISWAQESYDLVRQPGLGYCLEAGSDCLYSKYTRRYVSGNQAPPRPKKVLKISRQYMDEHARVVEQRLRIAGLRLAVILDAAL